MQIQYQQVKNMHRDKANVTLRLFVVFFTVICVGSGFIWNRAVSADVYMNDLRPNNTVNQQQYSPAARAVQQRNLCRSASA